MSSSRKSKLLTKKLTESTYGRSVFLVCGEFDEAMEYIKKRWDGERLDEGAYGGVYTGKDGGIVIYVESFSQTPWWYSVVSHEALHAVENILWHAGVKHTNSSREAWAYLLDSLVAQIVTQVYRHENIDF